MDLSVCVAAMCVDAHVGATGYSKLNMCHCAKPELEEATGPRLKLELYY